MVLDQYMEEYMWILSGLSRGYVWVELHEEFLGIIQGYTRISAAVE